MSKEYGSDFLIITDDEGNEFELEHLDTAEIDGQIFMAFLPADMDEEDEDFGVVILKVSEENGEDILANVDDEEELNAVFEYFINRLTEDDETLIK